MSTAMSSWLHNTHQLRRRGCRLSLRLVGVCLLPWARAADLTAGRITNRFVRLEPWTWHLSACLLFCFVFVQAAVALDYFRSSAFFVDLRGYVAPCVCEACLQCAGRQALPNSNYGELAISILELARATVRAVAAISKVFSDMCSSILAHPFLSMSALILSGLLSVAISEQA